VAIEQDEHTMTSETPKTIHRQVMTPLWVISLFVSLTEVVTGIAVTKAEGGIQIALTAFVIAFPLLVASAFFYILWSKPYVFYPPTEFSGGVDVNQYVSAMGARVAVVRADLQAETGNVRAAVNLEIESFKVRVSELENILLDVARQTQENQKAFDEYQQTARRQLTRAEAIRSAFEENSKYRIHVASVTREAPVGRHNAAVLSITKKLTELGFRTSEGGWGSLYFFPKWEESEERDTIKIIYKEHGRLLAERIQRLLSEFVSVPISLVSEGEAEMVSERMSRGVDFLEKEMDVAIAYCMR
jgi:hypothetical protein